MINALEIHDVENAVPPTLAEKIRVLLIYLIYALILLAVLPAILILLFHYIREKLADYQQSESKKPHHYQMNQPAPLLSLSEVILSSKLNKSPHVKHEKSLLDDLKEPRDYFVTIMPLELSKDSGIVLHERGSPKLVVRSIDPPFLTDFASIPMGAKTGAYTRAAIVHDWAYSYYPMRTGKGRKICDLEMLNIMRADRCQPFKRAIIYSGLRLFGGMAFLKAPARRRENNKFIESVEYRKIHADLLSHLFFYITGYFEGYGIVKEGAGERFSREFDHNKLISEIYGSR